MKDVIFYKKHNGKEPALEFLNILKGTNKKLFAKILHKINLLSKGLLGNNDIKCIGDKIFELRIKQSSNISRIFYFTYEKDVIILLDGIIKKDNKLKNNIINRINEYRKDFLKRIG